MNTADLHPKRFPIALSVARLRRLLSALQALELSPHDQGQISVDKQLELDRAGEQLLTHVAMLVADTHSQDDATVLHDTLPLLRASAKVLLTAFDRCRDQALREALAVGPGAARDGLREEALRFDEMMRQLSAQHGVGKPLGGASPLGAAELGELGLNADALYHDQ